MSAPVTIYLLRHGEVYNPDNILYGRMPNFYLSDNGRKQAQAAAEYLRDKPLEAIYASPMERAQETAQFVAKPHGLSVVTDERINESHTPFDGTPHSELEKTAWDIYTGNQPPYELLADMRQRALDFVQEKRAQHAGGSFAMVSHGDVVVTLFMWVMGKDPNDAGRGQLEALGLAEQYPATASISTLVFANDDVDAVPSYHYHRPY
jgi:broad specificity phosphatase PhoE